MNSFGCISLAVIFLNLSVLLATLLRLKLGEIPIESPYFDVSMEISSVTAPVDR